ncbi:hypothetical protein [Massilia sp. YIM B02443]|uniref:hypothetical protein n=1 Tax=Massilia sp. YIM B02443 TaxID=3050127 RepID=UPI0025B66D94|nr:hypothetical protein [Massilia sp. YIM B02443]MDN4040205.1 hypothetical protein [Massilia sp. YIM B02443]
MIPAEFRAAAGAIAIVGLVAIAAAGGWIASAWKHDAEIAELRRAHTEYRATLTEAALADVQADAATIRQAATEFADIQSTLAPKMTALTKELRNAKPLPAGCRPDADRVRNLDAAIDAANQSIPR